MSLELVEAVFDRPERFGQRLDAAPGTPEVSDRKRLQGPGAGDEPPGATDRRERLADWLGPGRNPSESCYRDSSYQQQNI